MPNENPNIILPNWRQWKVVYYDLDMTMSNLSEDFQNALMEDPPWSWGDSKLVLVSGEDIVEYLNEGDFEIEYPDDVAALKYLIELARTVGVKYFAIDDKITPDIPATPAE